MRGEVRANANGLAAAASVAGVWLWTWRHLAIEWRYNDQYAFGYAVPWLAGFLAWQRLRQPGEEGAAEAGGGFRHWLVLAWLAIPLFLLAELFRRQDPTWRLVGWLLTSAASLLTVGWVGHVGGKRLLLALAFPLAFTWLSLPWPSFIETPLTLGLLRVVTSITADVLNWAGVAALQRGNTIELRNAVVGVDNACSGVQSFQAALMATLFLGELFRLGAGRRVLLVAAGAAAAFLANLARVLTLAQLASQQGEAAINLYHDRVGASATAALFLVLVFLAWLASRSKAPVTPSPTPANRPFPGLPWRLPGWQGLACLAAAVAVPLLAHGWFRSGAGRDFLAQTTPLWSVNATRLPADWKVKPGVFTPEEVRLLRFTQASAVDVWSLATGYAQVSHLFWAPEATVPSQAFSHSPALCLPSAGWQSVGTAAPMTVVVRGIPVHGSMSIFRLDGVEEAVFHAIWYGGEPLPYGTLPKSLGGRASRFALLWRAPTRLGHETLTVFLRGAGVPKERNRRLEMVLETILKPCPARSGEAAHPRKHSG